MLPRAILFDMDDTLISAYAQPEKAWHAIAHEFAEALHPLPPLVVAEALMIEPTETESKETLDAFVEALRTIVRDDPTQLHQAPHSTPVSRPDDVRAARQPILRWNPS